MGKLGNLLNGLNNARFVVSQHDRHQQRIRPDGCADRIQCQHSGSVDGQVRDVKAARFQVAAHVQHGFMFGLYRNDMLAAMAIGFSNAFDGQIDSLGSPRREDKLVWIAV